VSEHVCSDEVFSIASPSNDNSPTQHGDASERATTRREAAQARASELSQYLTDLVAGHVVDSSDVARGHVALEQAQERSRRAHNSARVAHERAAAAHQQAALVHRQAARGGGQDSQRHQAQAAFHEAAATEDLAHAAQDVSMERPDG